MGTASRFQVEVGAFADVKQLISTGYHGLSKLTVLAMLDLSFEQEMALVLDRTKMGCLDFAVVPNSNDIFCQLLGAICH